MAADRARVCVLAAERKPVFQAAYSGPPLHLLRRVPIAAARR
jgi:hypothetical protein